MIRKLRKCRVFKGDVHIFLDVGGKPLVKLTDAIHLIHPVIEVFVYSAVEGPRSSVQNRKVGWRYRRLENLEGSRWWR